jgi:hypothetical protein
MPFYRLSRMDLYRKSICDFERSLSFGTTDQIDFVRCVMLCSETRVDSVGIVDDLVWSTHLTAWTDYFQCNPQAEM